MEVAGEADPNLWCSPSLNVPGSVAYMQWGMTRPTIGRTAQALSWLPRRDRVAGRRGPDLWKLIERADSLAITSTHSLTYE